MSKNLNRKVPWTPNSWTVWLHGVIERARSEQRPLLRAFADWLIGERGNCPRTARSQVDQIARLLTALAGGGAAQSIKQALASLSVDGVEALFTLCSKGRGKRARQCLACAMRSFLEFAALQGWASQELASAVPRLVVWRLSGLPRGLCDTQLTKLLATPWPPGECPRRDQTIVELLATYGVRCGQASGLLLGDVNWRERTIYFASHKGGKPIQHDLTGRVAQFLAAYLRDERPCSESPYVFLRCREPHLRLSAMAISSMVRTRMSRCGMPPRGPHTLRHTFATRLLRAGQPIKAIADLLGHRSLDTVAIYAKVDVRALLEVAVDWPEVLP